jgi:hypothetical protein
MPSKTVWIAGGIVVAIGAIAYLSYNKAPAAKDAAGTIVEAKRARSDGTNSFNPTPTASTTDQSASDAAQDKAAADAAKAADAAAATGSGDKSVQHKVGGSTELVRQASDAASAAGTAQAKQAYGARQAFGAQQAAYGAQQTAQQAQQPQEAK